MKKLLALLLALLIIPLSTQSYNAVESSVAENTEESITSENSAEQNKQKNLVALGDSITRGYGLNEGEKCYVDIVAEDCGFKVQNFAVTGQTSYVLWQTMKNLSDKEKAALEDADYIVMSIGGNDMLYLVETHVGEVLPSDGSSINADTINSMLALAEKLTPESMESDIAYYKKTIEEIVEIIYGLNDHAVITAQTVYNPFKPIFVVAPVIVPGQSEQIKAAQNSIESCIEGFNTALIEVSKTHNLKIADVYTDFKNSDKKLLNMSLQNPDIHPNAAGHKRIAEIVEDTIDPNGDLLTVAAKVSRKEESESAVSNSEMSNSSKASEFSTESGENVEISAVSDSSESSESENDYGKNLLIFISVMAVVSFLFTFTRLKRKKSE